MIVTRLIVFPYFMLSTIVFGLSPDRLEDTVEMEREEEEERNIQKRKDDRKDARQD